ncbi:ribulose-phosphate 3-epimerase [Tetragenococcus halophilus]|uniref:ribulose-phosphate 3-epimerase n=1 Tax=Tetragenococcus halophilus TaxID=51669 RepID=UPI000B92A01A|nr:ribulose-phosphate 3-epimerase [Tetragenococcus halophilus]MDN6749705.1 ribulose-phosphate 3-epimerase [Staphylococcus equorum]MCO8289121.1 ribulose-phosphate 3-epimerase [Tetragenococcus halophilus]MCO8295316.1 ribulose-phosphate 3-epimerase [Tetragenococcus halophilus]QXN87238.1 ribulose-phosphate 3-epimerase [Tetragenococcus halophilus]RQD30593.1 ribulose-phosphate 3-epimerase [Tetragenococcus halophilus subsp. halophilus DSM 20339]
MREIVLSPSIMCADLANLETSIKELEKEGLDTLHIDVIDGAFSPSMPIGIETIKRIRELTDMNFDIHMMTMNNEFFINEMLKIGVQNITFHYETSLHIDRYVRLIKEAGTKVSIALNPATSLTVLDSIIEELDMICLMLINPGFATNKNEKQVPYARKKIMELKQIVQKKELTTAIQVDGRVSTDKITSLVSAGAENLVLGSTSLFNKENTLAENKRLILEAVNNGNL